MKIVICYSVIFNLFYSLTFGCIVSFYCLFPKEAILLHQVEEEKYVPFRKLKRDFFSQHKE